MSLLDNGLGLGVENPALTWAENSVRQRIRNLTHQEGGLGTEQQGQMSTTRGQAVQLGSRDGTLFPLVSPFPTPTNARHRIRW